MADQTPTTMYGVVSKRDGHLYQGKAKTIRHLWESLRNLRRELTIIPDEGHFMQYYHIMEFTVTPVGEVPRKGN